MSNVISFMPQPLVGEHILSVVARWYLLSGNEDKRILNSLSKNAMQLSTKYIHHPMIDDVLNHFGEGLNRVVALAEHSLLPYYASLTKYDQLFSIIRQQKYQRFFSKERRKIPHTSTPTTRYNSVLKYAEIWRWCDQCVEEDINNFGIPYWHVAHQIPSTVRCYKHRDAALNAKCKRCDFEVKDLRDTPLPPMNGVCYGCGEKIEPIECLRNEALDWVEHASFDLLNCRDNLLSHSHNYIMQRGVQNFHSKVRNDNRQRAIFVIDEIQQEFVSWIVSNGFDNFFHEPERALSGKVLNINIGAYQAKNWPPLSVLLWLAYIGEPWPVLGAVA